MENINEFASIVHISAASPYMDEGTYQDTMLANEERKKHPLVTIVATNIVLKPDGSKEICAPKRYFNSMGVQIIRFRSHRRIDRSRGNVLGLYKALLDLKPDFIMDHVFCLTSCAAVLLYKRKNKICKVVADSHMTRDNYDDNNPGLRERVYNILQRLIGIPYFQVCDKVYGILPQTIEMIQHLYGVPKEKCEVLPLGYDDSKVDFDNRADIRHMIRRKYGISEDTIVFVHGGKLTRNKRTLEIVKAIKEFPDCFLIVFGELSDKEYEQTVREENDLNVIYTGYLNSEQIYDVFLASDIAVFPGKPSCLRQEAVATGLPIIYKFNDGDEGINLIINDNGIELPMEYDQTIISEALRRMINDFDKYKARADHLAKNYFRKYSYSYEAEYILSN